jgi:4'-phosphopantetheinyl transferase
VAGPAGPWARLLQDLEGCGFALAAASLAEWRAQLPPEPERRGVLGRDWERYDRLTGALQRDRFLATRLLIRHTAAVALGTEPLALELRYGLGGRVHVRGHDQIDVSLSHTGDLLLCGVASLRVIGVDAEPVGRRLSGRDVEPLMCTDSERLRLAATPPEERNALLLNLWTLKEAYSKALGQGLRFPFTEFGFRLGDGEARLERADGTPVADPTWRFATRSVGDGAYLAAVAVQDTRAGTADTRAGTALNRQIVAAIEGSRH